jgi:hypothetical protein
MRNSLRSLCFVAVAATCSLHATKAVAAAPADWSLAVERLFGFSRVTSDFEPGGSTTTTSVSLLAKVSGDVGYSAPRLAFDYIASSNITFGGAFGYQSIGVEDADEDGWLLTGRVGYFARVSSGLGLWPRVGITHLDFDASDATALSLEVPLEFFLERGIALAVTPHVDIGLSGNVGAVDRTLTEIGLESSLVLGSFFRALALHPASDERQRSLAEQLSLVGSRSGRRGSCKRDRATYLSKS